MSDTHEHKFKLSRLTSEEKNKGWNKVIICKLCPLRQLIGIDFSPEERQLLREMAAKILSDDI